MHMQLQRMCTCLLYTSKEESSLFFDTTKVSLDCTKCKGDLEQVSEGNVIKFYFFKYNIDGETVKIERIVR